VDGRWIDTRRAVVLDARAQFAQRRFLVGYVRWRRSNWELMKQAAEEAERIARISAPAQRPKDKL
jgi:hypothetical protein